MTFHLAGLLPLLVALPIGSFAGLLADRLPRGEAVLRGRSRCRACGTSLAARDLVPLLSWLALRGRCRHCAAPIGSDPLLAEALALLVATWAVVVLPPAQIWPVCALGWALVALTLADLRHGVLPDALTLPLAAGGLAAAWIDGWPGAAALGAGLGYLLIAGAIVLYRRLRGRDGMGWGDAKLLAAGGAWCGPAALPEIILLAALFALAVALRRGLAADAALPFGPALALAIWLHRLHGAP